jgi:hypothetical protein
MKRILTALLIAAFLAIPSIAAAQANVKVRCTITVIAIPTT